jgi:hypothetical protein
VFPRGRPNDAPPHDTVPEATDTTDEAVQPDHATSATSPDDAPAPPQWEPLPDEAATVLDPLERARAALADARRQMPGMLGEATDERPLPQNVMPPEPPDRIDETGIVAEVRALITQLQEERRRLAEEVGELRAVVGELRGEVLRLAAAPQRTYVEHAPEPPADPLAIAPGDEELPEAAEAPAADEGSEEEAEVATVLHPLAIPPGAEELPPEHGSQREGAGADLSEAEESPAESTGGGSADEVASGGEAEAPLVAAALRWHPVERGDFGFWARPEALDLLEEGEFIEVGSAVADTAVQRDPPESVAELHGEGSAESEVVESAAAAQADAPAEDVEPQDSPLASAYQAELIPGEKPLNLSVGPLHGVRRLSALEHRLAGCAGVERVELASYRGGEALFRVTLRSPASLQEVIGSLQGADVTVSAYSVDPDRGALRVRLAEHVADVRS